MARDRELIDPEEDDEPYLRRDERGRFDDEDVARSVTQDKKRSAKSASKKGQGRGDGKPSRKSDR